MTGYFKISTDAGAHPQTVGLSNAAFALWVKAGCWCVGHDRRFWVPLSVVRFLGATRRHAVQLEQNGLWLSDVVDGVSGWWFVASDLWDYSAGNYRERIPAEMRAAVLERDGFACLHCGTADDLQMDHVYPWSLGGRTTYNNLQTLCGPCNRVKGAKV